MKGVNQARYERDLGECRQIAASTPGTDAGKEGKKSATKLGLMTGAVLVGATVLTGGAALAVAPALVGTGAVAVGSGAAVGGYGSSTIAKQKYEDTITSCLRGRGYNILGSAPLGGAQ